MPRSLHKGWIDEYLDVIARYSESPRRWNYWGSVAVIQATLKRRVFFDRGSWRLYPNDYTVLVGRPGLGKGAAINPVVSIMNRANTTNVLSDKLTIEYILEKLSKGFPTTGVGPNGGISFGIDTSCVFIAPELAVFLRYPEAELPDLADLWDANPGKKQYGTRGKGLFEIEAATPTMLAGCAPEWLTRSIPRDAIGGGFTRRVNFIFDNGETHKRKAWPKTNSNFEKETEPLVEDLQYIAQIQGEYKLDNMARPLFEQYYEGIDPNVQTDEATSHYIISSWSHAIKAAMAISASKKSDLVICRDDLEEAITAVEEITDGLRIVFRSVGESDYAVTADKVLQFLEKEPGATFKQILSMVWKDASSDQLQVILSTLRDGDVIDESSIGGTLIYKVLPQRNTRRTVSYTTKTNKP